MDNNAPDSAIADSEVHLGESITNRIDAFAARFLKVTRVIEDGVAKVCIPLVKELHGLWTDAKALVNEPDHEHDEHDESVVPSKKFDSHIFQEIFIGAERKEQLRDLDGEFSTHETPEEKDSALRLVVGAGSFGITLFAVCTSYLVWVSLAPLASFIRSSLFLPTLITRSWMRGGSAFMSSTPA